MKKLERIIHITRQFDGAGWGTQERVAYHMAQESISRGLDCLIYCTNASSPPGIEKFGPVSVHRYPYSVHGQELTSAERLLAANLPELELFSAPLLKALKRDKRVSIFHTHVRGRLGAIVRAASRSRKLPYVVSLHGEYLEESRSKPRPLPKQSRWAQFLDHYYHVNRVVEDAAAILCLGPEEEAVVRRNFPKKRIYSIPPGVPLSQFKTAQPERFRRAHPFDRDDKLVLSVGAILPANNQLLLLRAFAEFRKLCPDYKLILIGPTRDPSYLEELYAEARWLGIRDGLLILKDLGADDPMIPSAYSAASIFVLPSIHHPFPNVILKAWAAGVPVITTSIGGISEFTRNAENALWIKQDDKRDLLEKMIVVARDQGLRERLIQTGRQEVSRQYDWSTVNAKVIGIYEEVLKSFR